MFDYFASMAPVQFLADLHEAEGRIAGLIEEFEDLADGFGPVFLTSVIEGSRRGCNVWFRKTYDELEPLCSIDYNGIVDPEVTEISGEWVRLNDGETGSFVMRRDIGNEQAASVEAEVVEPIALNR